MLAKASSCSLELSCPHLPAESVHCIEITLNIELFPLGSSRFLMVSSRFLVVVIAGSFNASKSVVWTSVKSAWFVRYIISIDYHKSYICLSLFSAPIANASRHVYLPQSMPLMTCIRIICVWSSKLSLCVPQLCWGQMPRPTLTGLAVSTTRQMYKRDQGFAL